MPELENEKTDNEEKKTPKIGKVCNVCLTFIEWNGEWDMGWEPFVCDYCYHELLEAI